MRPIERVSTHRGVWKPTQWQQASAVAEPQRNRRPNTTSSGKAAHLTNPHGSRRKKQKRPAICSTPSRRASKGSCIVMAASACIACAPARPSCCTPVGFGHNECTNLDYLHVSCSVHVSMWAKLIVKNGLESSAIPEIPTKTAVLVPLAGP